MSTDAPPLHIAWHGVPFTLYECRLACALALYVTFEDGTPLDDGTIGQVIGASSGLQNVDCAGLVEHLRLTNDVYPQVRDGGEAWAVWARDAYRPGWPLKGLEVEKG
ncbi:MAG: hypothetical protein ALECFALPRED_008159 [Alectoria fallacina]|uniref:Uncharacterized protein n=1 Tax=Alectoria fallacina TaxID=1903189 RepID=A0A8H3J2Q0_9LECA|nr:MAG: hypothetical protein ALECFALPRED_008159 [Alectoria fallacina]